MDRVDATTVPLARVTYYSWLDRVRTHVTIRDACFGVDSLLRIWRAFQPEGGVRRASAQELSVSVRSTCQQKAAMCPPTPAKNATSPITKQSDSCKHDATPLISAACNVVPHALASPFSSHAQPHPGHVAHEVEQGPSIGSPASSMSKRAEANARTPDASPADSTPPDSNAGLALLDIPNVGISLTSSLENRRSVAQECPNAQDHAAAGAVAAVEANHAPLAALDCNSQLTALTGGLLSERGLSLGRAKTGQRGQQEWAAEVPVNLPQDDDQSAPGYVNDGLSTSVVQPPRIKQFTMEVVHCQGRTQEMAGGDKALGMSPVAVVLSVPYLLLQLPTHEPAPHPLQHPVQLASQMEGNDPLAEGLGSMASDSTVVFTANSLTLQVWAACPGLLIPSTYLLISMTAFTPHKPQDSAPLLETPRICILAAFSDNNVCTISANSTRQGSPHRWQACSHL